MRKTSAMSWRPPDGVATEPFCDKGCKHVYEHVNKCATSETCEDPNTYGSLTNEALIEVYDGLMADYHRFGRTPIDWSSPYREYHRPTVTEAARRLGLVRGELLRRLEGAEAMKVIAQALRHEASL